MVTTRRGSGQWDWPQYKRERYSVGVRGLFIALMMEAVRISKTSVNFNVTTQRYIPEDTNLLNTIALDLERGDFRPGETEVLLGQVDVQLVQTFLTPHSPRALLQSPLPLAFNFTTTALPTPTKLSGV
jgi:hypothetical protein